MRRSRSRCTKFRSDFDLKASADYIDSVRGSDIDVVKEGNALVATATWSNKLHLVGNVSLRARLRGHRHASDAPGSMPPSAPTESLGHVFRRPELLRQALTHRSFGADHNERLEFIGDSILNCAIALALYRRFPQLPEGELSRIRANLVNKDTLCRLARTLDLGSAIRLGEGELKSGGASRPSILADALEAMFGAIFLDGGFDAADAAIGRIYERRDRGHRSYGRSPRIRRRVCRNCCRAGSWRCPTMRSSPSGARRICRPSTSSAGFRRSTSRRPDRDRAGAPPSRPPRRRPTSRATGA